MKSSNITAPNSVTRLTVDPQPSTTPIETGAHQSALAPHIISVHNTPLATHETVKNSAAGLLKTHAPFLILSFEKGEVITLREFADGKLPRTSGECYIPWAMTEHADVVYAKYGEHQGFNEKVQQHTLKPYTSEVSQAQRRLCQSALGAIALNNQAYTAEAVNKVTEGIRQYLNTQFEKNSDLTLETIKQTISHYFFTNGQHGFGRISEQDASTLTKEEIWRQLDQALDTGTLEQKLAIHDAIGRKVLPRLQGEPLKAYQALGKIVRASWLDQSACRGRAMRPEQCGATTIAGIVDERQSQRVGTVTQARDRAVDMFQRDLHRQSHPEADAFFDDSDTRNLLFGASISGTTGTLLQAAEAFGHFTDMEHKKQYILAIIGYLVGGGMHAYHESMTIAQKVGIPYNPGSYVESLPDSFKTSDEFKAWNHQYYDISTLGATHWRFNEGKLPSHLDKNLRHDAVTVRKDFSGVINKYRL
nr:hypothetical protein [uncultured Enterobacter sp.]